VLTAVDVEGESAYARAADVDELRDTPPSSTVRLLPGFDQAVLGPGTGDTRIVSPQRRSDISKAAGWIAPVVLRGGRVIGVWEADREDIRIRLFAEEEAGAAVSDARLVDEATRISAGLGRQATVTVSRD
jgi:hypothetical protein